MVLILLIKAKDAWSRLVNVVRGILHRQTHSTKLFSLPVIKLPDIDELTVSVHFSDVEKLIYDRIFKIFTDNIAG